MKIAITRIFGIIGILCSIWIFYQCYLFATGKEYSQAVFFLSGFGFALQWIVESIIRIVTGKKTWTFKFGKDNETTIEIP
jgi:hypothetical protein